MKRYTRPQLAAWGSQIAALLLALAALLIGGAGPTYGEFRDPCGTALAPRVNPFDLTTSCPPEVFEPYRTLALAAIWIAGALLVLSLVLLSGRVLRTSPGSIRRSMTVHELGRGLVSVGVLLLVAGLVLGLSGVITMGPGHAADCGTALFHFLSVAPTELCAPDYYHPRDIIALTLLLVGLVGAVAGCVVLSVAARRSADRAPRESTLTT